MYITHLFIRSHERALAASIHTPNTPTDKLAILCPGTVDSKDYAHLVALADVLTDRGYTAVRFNPTGTWDSDGDINEYCVSQYLRDIRAVIDHMRSSGSYTHILVGGHSLGGVVAMLYAARDPRVSAVINIMGSATFPRSNNTAILDAWKTNGVKISTRDIPNSTERREFIIPYTFATDRFNYQVLEDIRTIHVPLLLISGELDEIVPPEELTTIYEHANPPKQLITIPGIGHDYRHTPSEITLVNLEILRGISEVIPEMQLPLIQFQRLHLLKEKIDALYQSRHEGRADWADWLYADHVFLVAEEAGKLANRFGANQELAMAAGMLHDIADAVMSRFNPTHFEESKRIARSLLVESGFTPAEIQTVVDDAIALHSCHGENIPQTFEGKIMATADAVIHLTSNFYDRATRERRFTQSPEEIRAWALPKIERDFHSKILFDDVREEVRAAYEARKAFFASIL